MEIKENSKIRTAVAGIFWACIAVVLCCFPVKGQASEEVYLLLSSDAKPYHMAAEALQSSLSDKKLRSRILLLEELAVVGPDYFQQQGPKLWVAIGSRAATQLNTLLPVSMPLVYCMVASPEKAGLNPEREYLAGVSATRPVGEQFAVIQTAIPDLDAIGMLYRSSSPESMQTLAEVKAKLPENWRLEAVDVDGRKSLAQAIQKLFGRNIDLVWTSADSSIYNRAAVKSLLLTSLRSGVPVFGFSGSFVKAGALLGMEADPVLQGQRAAVQVLRCLGLDTTKSCVFASGVQLSVNLVVANRLGLTLPAELLRQADFIKRR